MTIADFFLVTFEAIEELIENMQYFKAAQIIEPIFIELSKTGYKLNTNFRRSSVIFQC